MKPLLTHTALEFKQNEVATLEYIQARGFFENEFPDLATDVYKFYNQYFSFRRGRQDFNFQFQSDFKIEIQQKLRRVTLHAEVLGSYDTVTYSLGICAKGDSNNLIRRFHFDYDHGKIRAGQRAFISHLQYGGKGGGTDRTGLAFSTRKLEDWLSSPRLNFPPINLALLLDIVLCEFQNERQKKIIEDPEWRSLILDNETFVLKQYFNSISNHLDSVHHNKDTLVRDLCYP